MSLSRRFFLRRGALALASITTQPLWGPLFLRQTALAAAENSRGSRRKTLICLFQRGAADGLSMVVPFGDPNYYRLRKEIALAAPSRGAAGECALDLDGFFGLHPAMESLLPIFREKHAAIVHACGSPNPTRSHFDAQDFMESGVGGSSQAQTGWLNRALAACPEDRAKKTAFRAVAMTSAVPRSLQGEIEPLAIPDLRTFGIGGKTGATGGAGFEGLYESAVGDVLGGAGRESFEALALLRAKADPARYQPAAGVEYPASPFGRQLAQIAQLVKAEIGLQVAFAETGGWDTHANQGSAGGQLAGRLYDFSRSIAALYRDLGDRMADVVILTMSEFGRAAAQNGNAGTDHGHATCFFALGGAVNGGRVLGKWPGLEREQLFEERDLAVTTDFRDLFAEIAQRHLGVTALGRVFPDHAPDPTRFRGLLQA